MKKLVTEEEVGLERHLGRRILFFCARYNYCGKLVGVSEDEFVLDDAEIVFSTGDLSTSNWEESAKPVEPNFSVMRQAVESFVPLS